MATASFAFQAGGDLEKALRALPMNIQRRVTKKAMPKATRVMVVAAKLNLRAAKLEGTGALIKSIDSKVKRYRSGNIVGIIGPSAEPGRQRKSETGDNRKPSKYAHLIEFGTKPHYMASAAFAGIVVKAFQHPGTKGVRFLTRAFDSHKGKTLQIFKTELTKYVKASAKRLAAKQRRLAAKGK